MITIDIFSWVENELNSSCNIENIAGRSNSRVYRVNAEDQDFVLKIYPDKKFDKRERLEVEYSSLEFLHKSGINNVPKVISRNLDLNIGLYEWIDGYQIFDIGVEEVNSALSFVKSLQKVSNLKKIKLPKYNASEACLSLNELVFQVEKRLNNLIILDVEKDLNSFLNNDFIPVFKKIKTNLFDSSKSIFSIHDDLIRSNQVLSPSDFGFHNAIMTKDRGVIFIDFDYFGWDDPVKLTTDFIWHPGMSINIQAKNLWVSEMKKLFSSDANFGERFALHQPMYGLRWCMILLNEFLPNVWEIRKHADSKKNNYHTEVKKIQLTKARNFLNKVKSII